VGICHLCLAHMLLLLLALVPHRCGIVLALCWLQVVRNEAGDLAEEVEKIDSFVHPKTKRTSQAFRVTYRDMTR
jgi:hypothetical protein